MNIIPSENGVSGGKYTIVDDEIIRRQTSDDFLSSASSLKQYSHHIAPPNSLGSPEQQSPTVPLQSDSVALRSQVFQELS
jgi:hypothetical protein